MAQSLSANDFVEMAGRPTGEVVAAMRSMSAHDFMQTASTSNAAAARRRACLANDPHPSAPQSQVDRLISDLMDIIVRAAAANGEGPNPESTEAVAEVVALSMMQALLQKQVCSSI
jgi:hypothetical protein